MIDRYLRGEILNQPETIRLPQAYVEPCQLSEEESAQARGVEPPQAAMDQRRTSFVEVELTLSEENARLEARRCLRCDLEFTKPKEEAARNIGGKVA
jgi:hypothetical protein